jgi:4-hydroxy-2-oxoheptanedioate aldolase
MDPRRVLDRLGEGQPVLALGIRNARTAEIARLARSAGFGMVWLDLEHSTIGVDCAAQIAAAAMDLGMEAWVRTAERDLGVIGRLLDGGVTGIIAPRIETPEQAKQVVEAARFPPRGVRSQIALLPQLDYRRAAAMERMRRAEQSTSVHILLESVSGIAAADEIAALDGVDALHVGANDLSVDLGHADEPSHGEVLDACRHVIAAARRHGKAAVIGGMPDASLLQELLKGGASPLIMAAIDTDLLAAGLAQRSSEWRTRFGIVAEMN